MDGFFALLTGLSIGERGIYIALFLILSYFGIIKIPFIKARIAIKKSHETCNLFESHKGIVQNAVNETKEKTETIYNELLDNLKKEHEADKIYQKKRAINKEKINKIKDKDILQEQMNKVSIKQSRVMMVMNSHYFSINKNRNEVEAYRNLLYKEKSVIKSMIRQWLRLNGYASMDAEKFYNYKIEHNNIIINSVGDFLDQEYEDTFYSISREELKASNFQNCVNEIKDIYSEMFDDCREIAIKYYKIIEELENEQCIKE